jgi:hypothetical protein
MQWLRAPRLGFPNPASETLASLLPEAGALVSSQPTAREAAAPEVVLCGLSAGSAGAAEAAHAVEVIC